MSDVLVGDAMSLDVNEVLVVYSRDTKDGTVVRRIVYGPTLYYPHSNEWLHKFVWHGKDLEKNTRKNPEY